MANQEHVDILKQGVATWNAWREENLDVIPDLSGAELNKIELPKANLKQALFYKIELGEQLVRTQMRQSNLKGANLTEADLRWVDLGSANLDGAQLRKANLAMANLGLSKFGGASLGEANLEEADLHGVFFTHANMSGANLQKANIYLTNFTEANMQRVNLQETQIVQAIMNRANLFRANLRGASFPYTRLKQANLHWANLDKADFDKCTMGATVLAEVDLRSAIGLETVWHDSPSIIDLSTIYRSQGQIPETLLRRAGVPKEMIVVILSMRGNFQHARTYLAYTFEDDAFMRKLQSDLSEAGVYCWRFIRDTEQVWNRQMFGAIEMWNRLWDRLIVVCSRESFRHRTMVDEVNQALELESETKEPGMLFPVCLDDETIELWNEHNRTATLHKEIYDFRRWKEPAAYQKAFQTLISDLFASDSATKKRDTADG